MPTPTPIVQLVTRIPRELRRRVKVHCLMKETTLTTFVLDAIVERLQAKRAARTLERVTRPMIPARRPDMGHRPPSDRWYESAVRRAPRLSRDEERVLAAALDAHRGVIARRILGSPLGLVYLQQLATGLASRAIDVRTVVEVEADARIEDARRQCLERLDRIARLGEKLAGAPSPAIAHARRPRTGDPCARAPARPRRHRRLPDGGRATRDSARAERARHGEHHRTERPRASRRVEPPAGGHDRAAVCESWARPAGPRARGDDRAHACDRPVRRRPARHVREPTPPGGSARRSAAGSRTGRARCGCPAASRTGCARCASIAAT